ncbi:hypothetical protein Tsubulata_033876 [Turnera subulata]|uniref:CCHC-type domain-containing protein n=1 Tax=Turnera subulata TaxID=218843 RepID=A0A9Q0GAL9_9ROSI|nr:hypothetical protein Tsubulata_033876 [Turnera subulata]
MSVDQPPSGGALPASPLSETPPPEQPAPARSFKDTVTQGSAWNEPSINADFAIKAGEGRTIGYRALNSRLTRLWQLGNGLKLIDLEHNYYMVKFYSSNDYMCVLTGGPWMVLGLYLLVERWRPNFHPCTHRVSSVVAWVRIPRLPAEHYHVGVLKVVCDQIRRTVRIDIPTKQTDRAQFARIAVELDSNKALEYWICFEGIWYHIEYEDLPHICFECGMAGHNMSTCSSRADINTTAEGSLNQSVNMLPGQEG